VPKKVCTHVVAQCKNVTCAPGEEAYQGRFVIRRDRTKRHCRLASCKKCRKCLNADACKISPCPSVPPAPTACPADSYLVTPLPRNGCPGVAKCRPKKCRHKKGCKKLPRRCPDRTLLVTPPAMNVTRANGQYTCEYTPCPYCKKVECPRYKCAYRECKDGEERHTPKDPQGCPLCSTCRKIKNAIDQFDPIEDETDLLN